MKQKEPKFYLDNPNSTTPTFIIMSYYAGRNVKHSTELKILPGGWNFERQEPKEKNKDTRKIFDRIGQLNTWVNKFTEQGTKKVDADSLKLYLLSKDKRKLPEPEVSKDKPLTMVQVFNIYAAKAENGEIFTKEGNVYTEGSIRNWKKFIVTVGKFNPTLTPDQVTMDTYNDFIKWCNKKDYTKNYTGDLIKQWKTLLQLSLGTYHSNIIHKQSGFRKLSEIVEKVYLNDIEIEKLRRVTLEGNLKLIRDRFVIMLHIGTRISDSQKLSEEHFKQDIIAKVNKKTGKKSAAPIHPIVEEILKEYDGKLPQTFHENTINEKIKIIAEMAGIDEKITYSITRGGKTIEETDFKYNLISTHTCRRSVATNLLKTEETHKVSKVLAMSLKTLERYNKISAEDNAKLMVDERKAKALAKAKAEAAEKSAKEDTKKSKNYKVLTFLNE